MAWWWGKGAGKDGKAQPEARWQPKDDVVCDSSMRKPRAVNLTIKTAVGRYTIYIIYTYNIV